MLPWTAVNTAGSLQSRCILHFKFEMYETKVEICLPNNNIKTCFLLGAPLDWQAEQATFKGWEEVSGATARQMRANGSHGWSGGRGRSASLSVQPVRLFLLRGNHLKLHCGPQSKSRTLHNAKCCSNSQCPLWLSFKWNQGSGIVRDYAYFNNSY